MKKIKEISAGIVLVRKDEEYKFLLLRAGDQWEFPKGRIEGKETLLETAIRETEEETGIPKDQFSFDWGRKSIKTEPYKKGTKVAFFFLARTDADKIEIPFNEQIGRKEHEEYKWISYNEAKSMLNKRLNKVLEWANESL